jgi:hypothetical protein
MARTTWVVAPKASLLKLILCDTDGFGQAQSQLSIQKHDVTVLGLDCCHAKEHGNYDECANGAMYNTVENSETNHNGAWQIVGPNGK